MEKHPANDDILHKRAKQYTLGNIIKSILMYLVNSSKLACLLGYQEFDGECVRIRQSS